MVKINVMGGGEYSKEGELLWVQGQGNSQSSRYQGANKPLLLDF